jgi:hypothetical protein
MNDVITKAIAELCRTLTHFKTSTKSMAKLRKVVGESGITHSLFSIGKTRFASLYYASQSIRWNLPPLYELWKTREIKIEL